MDVNFIFTIVLLMLSVIIHEVSHGYAAEMLGDPTARLQGRLSLNPLVHIDPFGTIILPLMSYFFGGFIIGWAKPVPFNPYNLRNQRWGEAIVAIAGPASNIVLALIFGLFLRFYPVYSLSQPVFNLISSIVLVNLILAVFNLMPVPPLDGSKILFSLFPNSFRPVRAFLEQNAIWIALIFIFFLWQYILPVVFVLFYLITGISA